MIMALSSDFPGVYTECWYQRAHYYWVAALLSPYVASAQWLGRVSGDEICREYCKGLLDFSGTASHYSCLCILIQFSCFISLSPGLK
ncbi:hypothetical protein HID58_055003 [Brassica napus]|uniref:Uncharacterized protein n=1 Tax=Brassica napus TaxID=3708 RepID=A0ABQ8AJ21_BRANA|nr:hypothetical protein HID58_055003 [Brassica napus]